MPDLRHGPNIKLVDAVLLDDNPTSVTSGWVYVGGMKRVTLLVSVTKANAPTNVILTADVSPDNKVTAIAYDKLIDHTGVDSPVSSVTYTATGVDTVSMSLEDTVDWIRVVFTATGTTSSATFTCNCWLLAND